MELYQHLWEGFALLCTGTILGDSAPESIIEVFSLVAETQRNTNLPGRHHSTLHWQGRQRDKGELGRDNENASCSHFDFYGLHPPHLSDLPPHPFVPA